uniref:PA14 domain-containing protein n=1 Tax=Globisporangium ultimum (strain ATCC 200006 / CBS 805.95 / DAOM BR144) TaxID=431595 RepID=K3X9Y0_GLOUD
MDDVSPTAYYTSSQVLFFGEGVVELAFQLTIHDDHIVEPNETFRVVLRQSLVDRSVSLGNQRYALVTILDDDAAQSDASLTYVVTPEATVKTGGRAGTDLVFKIQSVLGSGAAKKVGGDTYIMESYAEDIEDDDDVIGMPLWEAYRTKQVGRVVDNVDGTYSCTWQRKHAGMYTVAVYLLNPGGLRGDYYDDAWLELGAATSVISRIDRHVNFTWGTGPIFPGASDYVAVRWSGRLKPRASDDTIFHVEADDHVRLWVDDLLLIDKWDGTFTGQAGATIALDSSVLYAIVLEYRDLVGNARVHLSWSSASFAKEIIPASNLFSAQHISGSPFYNVTILPTSTANEMTTVIQGAMASIAGELYRIEIFPIDIYGNPRRVVNATNDGVEARLTLTTDKSLGGIGSKQNDAMITWDTKKGSLQATWTNLLLSGIYDLDVWVSGAKIYGSPFQVTVAPSAMHPTRSVVTGNGLASNRVAGVATTLTVEARDAYNNRIYSGGKSPELDIRAFHTTTTSAIEVGTVVDNGDGTYTLTYTPRIVGSYNVRVMLNNAQINNSPYLVSVVPNVAIGRTSTASGTGLSAAATNVQASFQVTARDLHGNDVKTGGATFQVILELGARGNVTGACTDLLSGSYSCTYTAKYVDLAKLHVILSQSGTTMAISGSPFAVDVVSGPALSSRCLAQGNGLVASVAGVRANFSVSIRDTFDNEKRNAGQETINVVFKGPAPATTTVAGASTGLIVSFVGNDTFSVSYIPTVKGSYMIQVQVNGVDVHASPFSMYTYPAGPCPATTTLDLLSPVTTTLTPLVYTAGSLITSRLTMRDAFDNVLETGGYAFQFDDVSRVQEVPLVDEANGSYFLSLRPRQSGVFPFQPKILLPDGLNATYFNNPDLVEPPILRRKDATIDFDYGVTPPTQTDAMETFSVRWNGYLLPKYSETFTFDVDVLGGVSLNVNNMPLLAGMWPAANRTESLPTPSRIYLVANQFVSFEVNYTKPRSIPNGRIRLFWRSLSQSHEVIPPNRLFTSWKITNNVPTLQIVPASAHPPSFTAEFPSATPSSDASIARTFVNATAGETLFFRVTARDQHKNVRRNGGDVLHVLFPQLPLDVTPFPVRITDLNNATYEISFSPILSGIFSLVIAATSPTATGYKGLGVDALAVFLRPYYIHQGPFTLNVEPNSAMAATSTITGDGFYQAVAGEEAKLTIQLRDLHSNPTQDKAKAAGSTPQLPRLQLRRIAAAGSTAAAIVVSAKVSEAGNGRYEAAYTPMHTGLYEVLLSVANENTFTSKSSNLRVYPNIASPLTSTISGGTGLGPQIHTNTLVTYRVLLNDFYSNPIEARGTNLVVILRGPEIVYPEVTQLSSNEYVVAYQVSLQGAYEMQTHLANHEHGLIGNYFETTKYVGSAAVQVINPNIHFDWSANETMRSYPRIQWKGYIKPLYSEQYTLQLDVFPAGAVYIDQSPVIDAFNTPLAPGVTSVSGAANLVGGRLHAITIEYRSPSTRELYGFVALRWQSDRQQREIVPSTAFFPSAQEINPRYTVVAVD